MHKVTLKSFEITKYEVTNLQYAAFLNKYGSSKVLTGKYTGKRMIYKHDWGIWKNPATNKWEAQKGYEYHPVINVTWYGANAYCEFYGLQLPSEAQWEYAARSGVETRRGVSHGVPHGVSLHDRYIYSGSNNIDSVAWYSKTSKGTSTFPVGLLKPNYLGLYDMSGNVWEWCNDWYNKNYYKNSPKINPKGATEDSFRVLRGGSWGNNADHCRVAGRSSNDPDYRDYGMGFRLARAF